MIEEEQVLIISAGQSSPCSDYEENSGVCKSTGELCDMCYENSLKLYRDIAN